MLAGKLDIGVMGDYPLLVNIARFQETNSLRSVIVSMSAYNVHGSGNSIVVPAEAPIYRFEDLKGKKVSVPFGSAAHGMLLKALVDRGLTPDFFTLINQAPPIGATSIQEKKIDAHADFCPWGELMEFKGFGRKIFDGSQASVAYLHGPVIRKDYLGKHPEIVVAYLKAIVEANEWITNSPEAAITKQEQWTSIPKEVLYLYFGRGGLLTLDATIKPKWVEVLKYDATVLQKMNIIKGADVEGFIDDRFIKQAYRELGRDYSRDQRVMVAGTSPMEGKDASTGTPIKDPRAAAEVWLKGEAIKPYASLAVMMAALREAESSGRIVNAAYDFDVRFQNIPSPGDVLAEAIELFGSPGFYVHILASLERIWLGFGIATVLGVGLGLLIGRFGLAEDTLLPPIELFRPIPAVAWVPISIMLWPTERSSIVFITTLGAFFPIVLNTIHGVEGIDRQLVRAATSLGAGRAAIFREVVLPGALPSIVTGLSVGMGVSWICLISAEMISGQFGVGYFTWVAYCLRKCSQILVGMLTIGVLGMLSSALIRLVGARCMPWLPRHMKDGA